MRPGSRSFAGYLGSALAAGALLGALAMASAPAYAQQRGTGVVEGPAGGGGGSGGAERLERRSAPQAPRMVSPRIMSQPSGQAGVAQRYRDPQAANAQRIYPQRTYQQWTYQQPSYQQPSYPNRRYTPRDRRRWSGPAIVTVPAPYGYGYGAGAYDPYYDAPYYEPPLYGAPSYGGYEAYPPAYPYPPAPSYPAPAAVAGPEGRHCATPQKVCLLYDPAPMGIGCSCRAPAGQPRFRGRVVP